MEVIHDSLWQTCLNDAIKMYQVSEANDKCYHLANATWILKNKYKQAQNRKDNRKTIMIEKTPDAVNEQRTSKKICQAITMSGKSCSFKAVCGDFCKKHSVHKEVIGVKIKI